MKSCKSREALLNTRAKIVESKAGGGNESEEKKKQVEEQTFLVCNYECRSEGRLLIEEDSKVKNDTRTVGTEKESDLGHGMGRQCPM